MKACLLEMRDICDKDDYDLRYFYFDEAIVGHYTSGVAFQSLMAIYRRQTDLARLPAETWYRAISKAKNPIVRGYLAEHVVLATIASRGLPAVDSKLDQEIGTRWFSETPDWVSFIQDMDDCCLYLPEQFNYPNIDGAILLLNRKQKQAHLFVIRVTLTRKHKDSEMRFYETQYEGWTKTLRIENFTVSSSFVWIGQSERSSEVIPPVIEDTQSGTRVVRPEYTRHCVSIESLDKMLYYTMKKKQ